MFSFTQLLGLHILFQTSFCELSLPILSVTPAGAFIYSDVIYFSRYESPDVKCDYKGDTDVELSLYRVKNNVDFLMNGKSSRYVNWTVPRVIEPFTFKCCAKDSLKRKCVEIKISTAPSMFIERPSSPGIPVDLKNVSEKEPLSFRCWAPPYPKLEFIWWVKRKKKPATHWTNETGHWLTANDRVLGRWATRFNCEIRLKGRWIMEKYEDITAATLITPLTNKLLPKKENNRNYDLLFKFGLFGFSLLGIAFILPIKHWRRRYRFRSEFLTCPTHYMYLTSDAVYGTEWLDGGHFGKFGRTRLHAVKNLPCAIKENKDVSEMTREFEVLKPIPVHPHILTLFGAVKENDIVVRIVTEMCITSLDKTLAQTLIDSSELTKSDRLKNHWSSFLIYIVQICRGMIHLHNFNIVHRDLAARNIFITNGDIIRIGDFGLSRPIDAQRQGYIIDGPEVPNTIYGPECFQSYRGGKDVFTKKSDVWSFGVLLFEMCSFGEQKIATVYISIGVEQLTKGFSKTSLTSLSLLNFFESSDSNRLPCLPEFAVCNIYTEMMKCWQFSEDDRPDFEELNTTFTNELQTHPKVYKTYSQNFVKSGAKQQHWIRTIGKAKSKIQLQSANDQELGIMNDAV